MQSITGSPLSQEWKALSRTRDVASRFAALVPTHFVVQQLTRELFLYKVQID